MRVKLFWKFDPMKRSPKNTPDFEGEINAWLQQNSKIKVVGIKQSASGGSVNPSLLLISIWYEDGT